MPRRIIALVNASAGTEGVAGSELTSYIETSFAGHQISADVQLVEPDELGPRAGAAVAEALNSKIGTIVAGGGDGTIRAVAEMVAGRGVSLGILPLGTLNHFARDIGLPIDLDAAIKVIAEGNVQALDVAEVNSRVFLNNSSIGMYPYMVLDRERRQRLHGISKWHAMLLAGLRTFQYLPVRRMSLSVQGQAFPYRTPCLFIGNNRYELAPLALGQRKSLRGGVLWICVAKQKTRLALLWVAVKALLGFVRQSDIETSEQEAVDVASRARKVAVSLDGEVEIMRTPLCYRIRPKHLLVCVPDTSK